MLETVKTVVPQEMAELADPAKLRVIRNVVIEIRKKYDTHLLVKNIRSLQDASRIQGISSELRANMLRELSCMKLLKEIVDGEEFES